MRGWGPCTNLGKRSGLRVGLYHLGSIRDYSEDERNKQLPMIIPKAHIPEWNVLARRIFGAVLTRTSESECELEK